MSDGWVIETRRGPAGELLAWQEPSVRPDVARIALCELTGARTVVVGRSQVVALRDGATVAVPAVEGLPAAPGVRSVERRSGGGGAVVLTPGAQVWVDIWVPTGHPMWDEDVIAASRWVGRAWARALAGVGAGALEGAGEAGIEVHGGAMGPTPWARRICFAGTAAGEVSVCGRKVVGTSQRRTRFGAWFQTMALLVWEVAAVVDDLVAAGVVAPVERRFAREVLSASAVGVASLVGEGAPPSELGALLARQAVEELQR